MNIVYDAQIFGWQKYGGISRYYYEIATRLAQRNECSVQIFAPFYVNNYFTKSDAVRPSGMKIDFPKTTRACVAANRFLSRLCLPGRRGVDIFHETYYTREDVRPRTAKRVITVYDMIHERFPQDFRADDAVLQAKAAAVKRADHVLCISETTRQDVLELLGVAEGNTSVALLSYSSMSPEEGAVATEGARPYILYVGQRVGYKNFGGLLQAFARSVSLQKDFSIVCFGGGPLGPRELEQIDALKIPQGRVQQRGGHDGVLAALYANASIFVCPSRYEGFGIPVLEAMSMGCPVACAGAGSLPEVVGDAAELFDPDDPDDICRALERVLSSRHVAEALKQRGFERIKQFSWDRTAATTLAAYARVLQA